MLELPPESGEHREKIKLAIAAMQAQHGAIEERVNLQIMEPPDYYDAMITQGKAIHAHASDNNCT